VALRKALFFVLLLNKPLLGSLIYGLNQTTRDWHTRPVILREAKGLAARFFAALKMTLPKGRVAKCTNVMGFDLAAYTQDEVSGHYRNNPEIVEQFDEARKVITAVAKNLGEEIDEVLALTMGLTDLIPREQLEKWAQSKNPSDDETGEPKAGSRSPR
jgi:hypothetical protein